MSTGKDRSEFRLGLAESLGCELMWGLMPMFWRLLAGLSALFVLSGRLIWAGVFSVLMCVVVRRTKFTHLFRDPRAIATFLSSGVLITINWGLYIWSTNSGHLLEASLGYYLSPIVTIVMGIFFFKERLSGLQSAAFVLALIGVGSFIVLEGGAIWIACVFAVTFSAYSAIKKKAGYDATAGLAFESCVNAFIGVALFGLSIGFPGLWDLTPASASASFSPETYFLLIAAAGLLTTIPMLLYSACANHIPLVLVGFMHYISPTMTTLFAIFMFHEAFTVGHAICFSLVWIGLVLVGIDAVKQLRKRTPSNL